MKERTIKSAYHQFGGWGHYLNTLQVFEGDELVAEIAESVGTVWTKSSGLEIFHDEDNTALYTQLLDITDHDLIVDAYGEEIHIAI